MRSRRLYGVRSAVLLLLHKCLSLQLELLLDIVDSPTIVQLSMMHLQAKKNFLYMIYRLVSCKMISL